MTNFFKGAATGAGASGLGGTRRLNTDCKDASSCAISSRFLEDATAFLEAGRFLGAAMGSTAATSSLTFLGLAGALLAGLAVTTGAEGFPANH
ncbi:MAG TPA: hypothetical protein PK347_01785 [Burkholderiaceae bacterium]|nr:hypothetical protein [Burkholderiaceae bacterium]